ncbi:hypothetical protein Acor_55310 [Acrocarpospora corrugata]|uniref:Type VII secretion system protein EssD-like domain-containing protein n=1 Tax=Acrocarpospora corrugata TaxID=35763 RepID=A0A5M3W357_9ACTN|nr:DNA/RNA non-specific endonuclease [Acrocarpospora corrugata]GES03465.1 hypothetical protein Acor_55310 [Acrocarpospora corrugata]
MTELALHIPAKAPGLAGPAIAPPDRQETSAARLTLPPGGTREAIGAVMAAVDAMAPGIDGRFHTVYRGERLSLTFEQAARVRATARESLSNALAYCAGRAGRATGLYQETERVNAESPITSGVVKGVRYVTTWGDYENPGEKLVAPTAKAEREIAEARAAIAAGRFAEAAQHVAAAEATTREMSTMVAQYRDHLISGGETTAKALGYTATAAFITLGALAVAVSGGAALGLAPEVIGAGIGGLSAAGTATVVSVGAPIVANVGTGAIKAAHGEQVDWAKITTDAAVQVILARFGGKAGSAMFAKIAGRPEVQALTRQAVAALLSGVATHELSQAFTVAVEHTLAAWRGRFSWDGFRDDLIGRLLDPVGLFMAVVMSGAHLGINRKIAAASAKSRPAPGANPAAATSPPPAAAPPQPTGASAGHAPTVTATAPPTAVKPGAATSASPQSGAAKAASAAKNPVSAAATGGTKKAAGKGPSRDEVRRAEVHRELHGEMPENIRSQVAGKRLTVVDERPVSRGGGKPQPPPKGVKPFEERVLVGDLDEHGHPTGIVGELHPSDIRTGTSASNDPTGVYAAGDHRGHLLGKASGGSGSDRGNLAWMDEAFNKSRYRTQFEIPVENALAKGQSVAFDIQPRFKNGRLTGVQVWARTGSGELIVPPQTIFVPP